MDMSASRAEVISVDDGQLIELLRAARRKIFFAGPGMSLPVVQALCEQLKDGIPQVLKSDEQLWGGLLRLGRQYYRHHVRLEGVWHTADT